MPFKKCYWCGQHNQNKNQKITVFDVSKKSFVGHPKYEWLCEVHFHAQDILTYKDGSKRYVYMSIHRQRNLMLLVRLKPRATPTIFHEPHMDHQYTAEREEEVIELICTKNSYTL